MSDIIDSHEAARFLGVARITVYRNAREGTIPAFRIGKSWRFDREELKRWIQQQHSQRSQKGAN